jgi:glycosyltransferase involved in cell wall biosynthesis
VIFNEIKIILQLYIMRKAIVVHAGRRDSYQVALALYEKNLLEKLVTDIYFPGDNETVDLLFKKLNKTEMLYLRSIQGLPFKKVSLSLNALTLAPFIKFNNKKLGPLNGAVLGAHARRLAEKTGASIISYSTCAMEALKNNNIKNRFLFQLHPYPLTVRNIFYAELELVPQASYSLLKEWELCISEKEFKLLSEEPFMANGWLAASTFTANTMAENGIDISKIQIVPYGVSLDRFKPKLNYSVKEKLNIIFVGSFNQRKGISYLLDAVRIVGRQNVNLTLVGRGIMDSRLISFYNYLDIDFKINIPHSELVHEIQKADIMVLPSLVEGFGQVILECMACGTPVITTPNTAGPDIIDEGVDGFIVPIRSSVTIAEKIEWCINHKSEVEEMGKAAAKKAALFTWGKFREGIRDAYFKMLSNNE